MYSSLLKKVLQNNQICVSYFTVSYSSFRSALTKCINIIISTFHKYKLLGFTSTTSYVFSMFVRFIYYYYLFLSLPFYIGNFQGSQGHLTDTVKRIFPLRRLDYFQILDVYVVANCTVNTSQDKKQQFDMLAYYDC